MENTTTEYCMLWIQWWPMCMQKGEWASWVQAVFSVAAIAAAIVIGQRADVRAARGARNHLLVFKATARTALASAMQAAAEENTISLAHARALLHDAVQMGQTVAFQLLGQRDAIVASRYRAMTAAASALADVPISAGWRKQELTHLRSEMHTLLDELDKAER